MREKYEVTNEMFIKILFELLGIIIIWLGLVISVLIHETGHMTGYKLAEGKEGAFRSDLAKLSLKRSILIFA